MLKLRFLISALTVLAASAIRSASASAGTHVFTNNGTAITGTLSILSQGALFTLAVGAKTVTCHKVTDRGLVLTGGRDFANEIHFLECLTGQQDVVHSHGAPNG